MTGEEQRKIAYGYLNGTDGLSKNEKKGWEAMKQAADLGDGEACFEYAEHIVEKDGNGALEYIKKGDLDAWLAADGDTKYVNTYINALARRAMSDPASAKDGYAKASGYDGSIYGMGWYWLAELGKRAGADKETIRKYLSEANTSDVYDGASDGIYAEYGLEKGVLIGKEQFKEWINRYLTSDRYEVKIVAVKKQEGMARALAEAALGDKSGKRLGKGRISKMKSLTPSGILEYQAVRGESAYRGTYSYGFKHQASNSVTYTTGSGTVEFDKWFISYGATFKCKIKNDDLNDWINNLEYTDEIPDARVRVKVEREFDVLLGANEGLPNAYDLVRGRVAKKYNWYSSDITLNSVEEIESIENRFGEDKTFVPFWFFHYKLDKETVTARVNACTGEVDFFINNPYGQFTKNDDAKKGGDSIDLGSMSDPTKFSVGKFLLLSIVTCGVGGALYILSWIFANIKNKIGK